MTEDEAPEHTEDEHNDLRTLTTQKRIRVRTIPKLRDRLCAESLIQLHCNRVRVVKFKRLLSCRVAHFHPFVGHSRHQW
jgi:hypothetical protein